MTTKTTLMNRLQRTLTRTTRRAPLTPAQQAARDLRREWDRQLALAISDRDRAEIDAIFSRADAAQN